jgi:hypothetical protein
LPLLPIPFSPVTYEEHDRIYCSLLLFSFSFLP